MEDFFTPPHTPLFNVVGKAVEVGNQIHKGTPPPKGKNTAPLAGSHEELTLAPPTLKKGVRGRSASIAFSFVLDTVSRSGAIFFPSTVVPILVLLLHTRLHVFPIPTVGVIVFTKRSPNPYSTLTYTLSLIPQLLRFTRHRRIPELHPPHPHTTHATHTTQLTEFAITLSKMLRKMLQQLGQHSPLRNQQFRIRIFCRLPLGQVTASTVYAQ